MKHSIESCAERARAYHACADDAFVWVTISGIGIFALLWLLMWAIPEVQYRMWKRRNR